MNHNLVLLRYSEHHFQVAMYSKVVHVYIIIMCVIHVHVHVSFYVMYITQDDFVSMLFDNG